MYDVLYKKCDILSATYYKLTAYHMPYTMYYILCTGSDLLYTMYNTDYALKTIYYILYTIYYILWTNAESENSRAKGWSRHRYSKLQLNEHEMDEYVYYINIGGDVNSMMKGLALAEGGVVQNALLR